MRTRSIVVAMTAEVFISLLHLIAVLAQEENGDESYHPDCSFTYKALKQQCYNPLWCAGVLSSQEYFGKPSYCKHLHKKVECLTVMVDEHSKACAGFNSFLQRLDRLTEENNKTVDRLHLLESSVKDVKGEIEGRFSDITRQILNNTTASKNDMKELFKTEHENVDTKLKTLNDQWIKIGNTLNKSFDMLNSSFNQYRAEVTDNLAQISSKTMENITAIEERIQTVNNSISSIKTALEEDIENKIKNSSEQSFQIINEASDTLNQRVHELSETFKKEDDHINTKIEDLSQHLTDSKQTLNNQIETETKKLSTELDQKNKDLDSRLAELKKNTYDGISGTKTKLSELEKDIKQCKSESDDNLRKSEDALKTLIKKRVSEVQVKLDNSVEALEKSIESLKADIRERIKHEVDQLSLQTKEVNQTLTKQKERVDIIYPNVFNKEMFSVACIIVVVLLAINYLMVYSLVKRTSQTVNRSQHQPVNDEPHSPAEVFNRVSFSRSLSPASLDNSVGVISFYEGSQEHHKLLMASVIKRIPEKHLPEVKYHVIRRHESILRVPRSRLCIMFVEFSERHVIIEEPGLGLGDLKRKSVEHINKLGACLVIVYVKDPGSRNIKNSELFNSSIHCVKSQPELKALNENGRFLSIYDKFMTHQIDHLVDIITTNLRQTGNALHLRL